MIVWLASYPRSGNTFLRIILHRVYGVPTYSVYDDDDPVAQRVGTELVGYRPKPLGRSEMIASDEVYFVKTHKRRKSDGSAAIYLVRDGRDAVISHAYLRASTQNGTDANQFTDFQSLLREEITRPYIEGQPSSGTWGGNVLSWLATDQAPTVALRFEELIADPIGSAIGAVQSLLPDMVPRKEAKSPLFQDLQSVDPVFFRKGRVGAYRDEMSLELQELFWAQPENAAAMRMLNYR